MVTSSPLKQSWADVMSEEGETPGSSPAQASTSSRARNVEEGAGSVAGDLDAQGGGGGGEEGEPCEGLDKVLLMVRELYAARDGLFSVPPDERINALKDRQHRVIEALEALPPCTRTADRALSMYIRGKALDVTEEHVPEAEELLGRAVKLLPTLGDGWNQLGSCFWKKGDYQLAFDCWQHTLRHTDDSKDRMAAMRELSMAHRVKGNNPDESLRLAKEVVAKDMADTQSWYNLANAYMSHFFSVSFAQEDLTRALQAYHKSEGAAQASANPDLHYNQATVHRYLEEYQSAVDEFERADLLDPLLRARESINQVANWVASMHTMVSRRCRLKTARITQALAGMQQCPTPLQVEGRSFAPATLAELQEGKNPGAALQGMIMAAPDGDLPLHLGMIMAAPDGDLPRHLVVSDSEGQFLSVSVYNLRKGVLKPGDTITLLAPMLITCSLSGEVLEKEQVKIEGDDDLSKGVSYRCVQTKPTDLLHNGRTCDASYFERPKARFTVNPTTIQAPSSPYH